MDQIQVSIGQRVEISPAYDHWMRGDRYGEVIKITAKCVHVKLDKSGKTLRIPHHRPTGIYAVIPNTPSNPFLAVADRLDRSGASDVGTLDEETN